MTENTFDAWAREGIADAARDCRDYVVRMTAAIEAAGSPADAAVLIRELLEWGSRHHPLDAWEEMLPQVEGRRVRYGDEGISVEDAPSDADDEIPF